MERIKPFDRHRIPPRQNIFLLPIIWVLCLIVTFRYRLKIKKTNMGGLKPPFLVLSTHHSFMDFYVTPLVLFPFRANYISELEGFEYWGEWLYRQVGCLGTRKFVYDLALIKNIKKVIERKDIMVIYPEARYANVGTSSKLPISVAKLAKTLGVPLVILNMKGNYIQSPIWNNKSRKGARLEAEATQIFTKSELENADINHIYEKIEKYFSYDDYKYQYDKKIKIDFSKGAEGLELVLYRCPRCDTEFSITSSHNELHCNCCNTKWKLNSYGKLEENNLEIHIPDWYEWQREKVIEEIEKNEYFLQVKVRIEALPNAKKFIDLGSGLLRHDKNGFFIKTKDYKGNPKELIFTPQKTYSIHTEYNYRGKGQCIVLSELDDSYFIYSDSDLFNVTKIQFAVEYLFNVSSTKSNLLYKRF